MSSARSDSTYRQFRLAMIAALVVLSVLGFSVGDRTGASGLLMLAGSFGLSAWAEFHQPTVGLRRTLLAVSVVLALGGTLLIYRSNWG